MNTPKRESLTLLCGNQPVMGFVLLFCVALTGATIFSDVFSEPFDAGLKYGMAAILGLSAVLGVRKRYRIIFGKTASAPEPETASR